MSASARSKWQVILSSLLALGSVGTARAADRFVSPTGSDSANDCLSSASPCRTAQYAVSQAASGDTIKLAKGRYMDHVIIVQTSMTVLGGWSEDFTTRDVTRNRTIVNGPPRDFIVSVGASTSPPVEVTLDGLTISHATLYGAISLYSDGDASVTLTLSHCILLSNVADGESYGGGVTAVAHNSSAGSLQLTVADSTFKGNRNIPGAFSGLGEGGGINAVSGFNSGFFGLTVSRSLFLRNRAQNTGGAILFEGSSLTIADSQFVGNKVGTSRVEGDGGAIAIWDVSDGVNITNTFFAGNRVRNGVGGALSIGDTFPMTFVNDTIVRNRVGGGGGGGGLSASGNATVSLKNVILWGNGAVAGSDLQLQGGAVADADHDDIGLSSGTVNDLGGNVSVDPRLVGGFELSSTSPLIDAGTCTGAPSTDIEGDPRPSGSGCDIGADEFVP